MSTAEERELLARISQVAGQINRRRNQQAAGMSSTSNHYHPVQHHNTGRAHTAPYRVTRPTHRHRKLVLNGASAGTNSPSASESAGAASDSSVGWVSRHDRHLQLINSNVYEKDAQTRTRAIEQTRQQKLQRQDEREKAKLKAFFLSRPQSSAVIAANGTSRHELEIEGIRFRVVNNGGKLVKIDDRQPASATPKVTTVGGVQFFRSKNGNLYRDGILRAHRKSGVVKKINQPCKIFSQSGSCPNGPRCRYIHDATKVAACKDFLQKGTCLNGEDCDLSHDLTAERTPTCLHYTRGNCVNTKCPYVHSNVSPSAPVCKPFGLYGYCEAGAKCPDRHAFECPDFSNFGRCKTKGCKLPHRERASVLRKAMQKEEADAGASDDLSSDNESVGSDDVDSDEVEELFADDGLDDSDVRNQTDFLSF